MAKNMAKKRTLISKCRLCRVTDITKMGLRCDDFFRNIMRICDAHESAAYYSEDGDTDPKYKGVLR